MSEFINLSINCRILVKHLLSVFFLSALLMGPFAVEVKAQQSSIVFADDGSVGKRQCWHPQNDPLSYTVKVLATPGKCGLGKYEIQWGDGTTTKVTRDGPQEFTKTYNLASYRANIELGLLTYNIFITSTDEDCPDLAVARLRINKIPIPVPSIAAACEDVVSTFSNHSYGRTGQPLKWTWTFSDGITSEASSLTRRFTDPDQDHWVKLSVTSEVCNVSFESKEVPFKLKKLPKTSANVKELNNGALCFTDDSDSTLVLDASASSDANRFHWSIVGGKYKVAQLMKPDSSVMKIKMLESADFRISITPRNECGAASNGEFSTSFQALPLPEISLVKQPDGCEELKYRLLSARDGAVYMLDGRTISPDEEITLPVSTKEYIVTGSVTNACGTRMDSDSFYVHPKAPVEITSLPLDTTICYGTNPLPLEASRAGGQWSQQNVQLIAGKSFFYPNSAGDFEVSYQVGTGLCLSSATRRINVLNELAVASIGLDEADLRCAPARIVFSNRSKGNEAGYSLWQFEENGPETETASDTISHVFNATDQEAVYTVRLKVRNVCGVSEATRVVKILPSAIKPLFTLPAGTFCPNSTVAFQDATVPAPNHWKWDFGDAQISNVANPEHQYGKAGTYTVTLEAGNQCATGKVSHVVEIQAPPTPEFSIAGDRACDGEEVVFTNNTDTRYTFAWDFGDGSPPDEVNFNPAHTFSQGEYKVTLTIFDGAKECSTKKELPVTIAPVLQPAFTVEVAEQACEPALVKFVNQTPGGDRWRWEISDGTKTTTTNVKEPLLPFKSGGYTIQLTASKNGACEASTDQSVSFDFVKCNVDIPQAFTPNGDQHGDRYTLFGDGIDRIIFMRIRNRWSEVVYEMADVPAGSQSAGASWDGTKNGKDLPADMYVFEAKVRYRDQTESDVIRGNFYLVR